MATVEFKKIGKNYGSVEVLNNLDLSVEDAEFVVLLGSSGCGKTTLLRMTAGLETVTAGDILIDGRKVNSVHPRDRDIAMVFQNYALYPTMRVYDNIAFSLQVAKRPKSEIREKVTEAADVLGLTPYLDRFPKELSGGQRQRVAMGRAMVRNAKVFLFDEPLSNLDAKLRAHMRVEIRQLHDRLATTTIYVTHDQIEAMTMADKIVLMHQGRIIQVGTPDDLYDLPNSKYVAEFIGSPTMNFLSGHIHRASSGSKFTGKDIALPLPAHFDQYEDGRAVTCGIRPADVSLSDSSASGDPGLPGKLDLIEKTGADVQLHATVEGAEFVAVVPRGIDVKAGSAILFGITASKLHVFDAATELRL